MPYTEGRQIWQKSTIFSLDASLLNELELFPYVETMWNESHQQFELETPAFKIVKGSTCNRQIVFKTNSNNLVALFKLQFIYGHLREYIEIM